ncbi:MAG: hypothetical protein WBE54_22090, partial [Bradyrhizobium sp.]
RRIASGLRGQIGSVASEAALARDSVAQPTEDFPEPDFELLDAARSCERAVILAVTYFEAV